MADLLAMLAILRIDQWQDPAAGQGIERAAVVVLIAVVPGAAGSVEGDDIAPACPDPNLEQEGPKPRQLAIRQLDERGREPRAIETEDAKVEPLERRRSDGQGRRERQGAERDPRRRPTCGQTEISFTSPMRRRGSVSSCTCSAVTPGATSTSLSPSGVTSSTQ
jgi:hypothetical protein